MTEQINQLNQERLSDIEMLEMTVQVMMEETEISETTNQYVKEVRNGKAVVVPDLNSDQMFETPEVNYDGSVERLV